MPAVERFGARVRELLEMPLSTHADGGLQPAELALSPPAHAAWVQAHDRIERALASGGELSDIRDVAAKAAENIARLAALFHVLAHGPVVCVRPTHLDGRGRQAYDAQPAGVHRCGSNSSTRLAGCVGRRSSTSLRYA
jgi:putative DNA primase/helicase